MKSIKIPLLGRVAIAIVLGILLGQFVPVWFARVFATFNGLFGNFLSFIVPLIILGLVTPAISELGRGAGKLLVITLLIAYFSTLFSGFFTYFSCQSVFPKIITGGMDSSLVQSIEEGAIKVYFSIQMPPVIDVMAALILSFCLGLGASITKEKHYRGFLSISGGNYINHSKVIIPYCRSIFLGCSFYIVVGQVFTDCSFIQVLE